MRTDRYPLPEEFNSLTAAAEFWDTHDSAEYEDLLEEISFEINLPPKPTRRYAIAKDLAAQIDEVAKEQGISTQMLINLWLQEKLTQVTS